MEFDSQAGWKGVETRIKRMELRRRHLKLLRYVALFIAPVLILVFAFQDISVPHVMMAINYWLPSKYCRVEPKLFLHWIMGKRFIWMRMRWAAVAVAGKQIQIDSTTLNYSAADGQVVLSALAYNKVEVPRGGEYTLVLNDGTKVHLNSMSSLRFPLAFEAGKREVELAGEAYFEVNKTGHPFIVSTQGMQIEVLGTTFNISAYPGEEYQATLVSGSVKVDTGEGQSLVLKPSQQASLIPGSGNIQVRTVDTAFYTSWVKGKINFKDQRLEDIMRILSRWYNIEVDYSDEALKNLRFGCYVNRYEEIAPFLELLEATENIHVKINGKTIIFYK